MELLQNFMKRAGARPKRSGDEVKPQKAELPGRYLTRQKRLDLRQGRDGGTLITRLDCRQMAKAGKT